MLQVTLWRGAKKAVEAGEEVQERRFLFCSKATQADAYLHADGVTSSGTFC